MTAIGREDLRDDPALAKNDGRAAQMERIDAAIAEWTSRFSQKEVLEKMQEAEVPAGRIYSAADIAADPHYAAREDIVTVDDPTIGPVRSAGRGRSSGSSTFRWSVPLRVGRSPSPMRNPPCRDGWIPTPGRCCRRTTSSISGMTFPFRQTRRFIKPTV